MNRLLPLLVVVPLPLLTLPVPAAPQAQELAQELTHHSAASREDSLRTLRAARTRQAAFERIRRANLPWAWSGGRGECDERIGRFCLTYSRDDAPEWEPPPEKPAVIAAREQLLGELVEAAATIPGDRWVSGQLVRYLVEASRFQEAWQSAAGCRGERWWCEALAGFAAHHAGDAHAAHAAFDQMLSHMPDADRREWTDLSAVLPSRVARRYKRLNETERAAFEQRFWAVADPLYSAPGNDLRSEHFSRAVLVALQDRSETTENLRWGDDLREILLRFGPPSGWEQIRNPYSLHRQDVSLVSHYPDADIDLLPPPELLEEEFHLLAGRWDEEGRRARASYPLPRGEDRLRWITTLPHQVAVFHSGDSAMVVAAYELPDSMADGAIAAAALAVIAVEDSAPRVAARPIEERAGVLSLVVPHQAMLLSLEVTSADRSRAGRARFGLEARPLVPGVLAASDLLLMHAVTDTVASTRAEALALARGSTELRAGERVGIYWEMYSPAVPWPPSLDVSLRLVAAQRGWFRRLAERAGVLSEVQPIRITWGESMEGEGMVSRSLTLRIPEETPTGAYTLELSLLAPGREPLIIERSVQVTR